MRDARGEPADPVLATADGTVVYVNRRPGYSTFGNYILLRHRIEDLEIYSLYAHLREVRPDLEAGATVRSRDPVGVMGRTASTRDGISKERAHVHFELGLLLNDRFAAWHQKRYPKNRNDHGDWNGQTLIGLDPWHLLVAPFQHFGPFSLTVLIRNQTELCRVIVRDTEFPWLRRYAPLVKSNPAAALEGIAGYEIALNYVGMPFELIPRTAREIPDPARVQLVSVNEAEHEAHRCGKLVVKKAGRWELSPRALNLLDLLTY
jgi:murein DD-endopeptidase MepM/ murein hydrolase activator NlpD